MLSYFSLLLACGVSLVASSPFLTQDARLRGPDPLLVDDPRLTFNCPALAPSAQVPTSVHALRPSDIKHIASMGDSLTAANGANAWTLIGLLIEYRGVSWSIGGDSDLSKIVTLPNILRKYNANLNGFSTGTGDRDKANAGFNVAKAGATSADMVDQANMLVTRMTQALGASRFASEWKLVTFFIGGNDLCSFCKDASRYSATNYRNNIKAALDILLARMPRTLVNFVTVLNVAELEDLNEGRVCATMQSFLCDCAINKNTREQVRAATIEYQKVTNALIDSGIYDTKSDFTIVRQPFMEHMKAPTKPDGKPDFDYFGPDCFHFSAKGHEAAATELWNNMMQRVGQKSSLWDMADTLMCPPAGNGYIFTSKNSS